MQNTVALALAEAPLPDQLAAIKLTEYMRFDRMATDDPTAYAYALRQRLLDRGMPVHVLDGTTPDNAADGLAAAEAKLDVLKARADAAMDQANAAVDRYFVVQAEVEAYHYARDAFRGALAEGIWTGHADHTATTTLDGRRYRYFLDRDELWLLGSCPTNTKHDHIARVVSHEQLRRLQGDALAPGWICELGLCPDAANPPLPAA